MNIRFFFYWLSVLFLVLVPVVSAQQNRVAKGSIENGQSVSAVLEAGEQHEWTFEAQEGQQVTIDMVAENGAFNSNIELYRGDIEIPVAVSTGYNGYPVKFGPYLLATDTYTIVASAFQGKGGEAYKLTLGIIGDDVLATAPTQAADTVLPPILQDESRIRATLSPNEITEYRLEENPLVFRYPGEVGQVLTLITMTENGSHNPYVEFYGPYGNRLLFNDPYDGKNARLGPYKLENAGTYFIVVKRGKADVREFFGMMMSVTRPDLPTSFASTFEWRSYNPGSTSLCRPAGISTPSIREDAAAVEVLRQRPFNLTRLDWLYDESFGVLFGEPPLVWKAGPDKSEADVREELNDFLSLRFPDQPERVNEGLALLDHPILVEKIPDYRLRAALLTNLGTVGEVAIDVLLKDKALRDAFSVITFFDGRGYSRTGFVINYATTFRLEQVDINEYHRNNPIETLGAVLFHELMHLDYVATLSTDESVGAKEEIINAALDTIIYLQNLLLRPESFQSSAAGTRLMNFTVTNLLNLAAEDGGVIDFTRMDGRSIFPGSSTIYDNFPSLRAGSGGAYVTRDTEGSAVMREAIAWLARCSGRKELSDANFNTDTINWINELYRDNVLFSDAQILQAATSLGMAPAEVMPDPMPEVYPTLLFSSAPEGSPQISRLNPDGSLQNLTDFNTGRATWSPDGSRIAFGTSKDGNSEIYIMNADGTDMHNLTRNEKSDRRASWSPDGSQLVFASNRDGTWGIYVMNADGSGVRKLVGIEEGDAMMDDPIWSPDGLNIVYESNQDEASRLYLVNSDGSEVRQLVSTDQPNVINGAVWSPDGLSIAYVSNEDGDLDIYTVKVDGSDLRNLTDNDTDDIGPRWSPDGTQIAFSSSRNGNSGIFVMNADGSNVRPLSDSSAVETGVTWSPDGSQLAFHANRAGTVELYTVDLDDGEIWRLTNEAIDHVTPLWQPSPALSPQAAFCTVSAKNTVNLRSGPGTNYDQAGTLRAGAGARVTEQSSGADGLSWWHLADGSWVRSDVVDEVGSCEGLPEAVTP